MRRGALLLISGLQEKKRKRRKMPRRAVPIPQGKKGDKGRNALIAGSKSRQPSDSRLKKRKGPLPSSPLSCVTPPKRKKKKRNPNPKKPPPPPPKKKGKGEIIFFLKRAAPERGKREYFRPRRELSRLSLIDPLPWAPTGGKGVRGRRYCFLYYITPARL